MPNTLRDKAQVIILFGFCLLNPFAGWAYLLEARHAERLRPPSIADTVKPTRLAILPLIRLDSDDGLESDGHDWTEAFEVDFVAHENLDVVPLARAERSLDVERDVLALGKSVHADLVLDARALVDGDELRVYARLVRLADASVRWSQLFVGPPNDLTDVRERVQLEILARV